MATTAPGNILMTKLELAANWARTRSMFPWSSTSSAGEPGSAASARTLSAATPGRQRATKSSPARAALEMEAKCKGMLPSVGRTRYPWPWSLTMWERARVLTTPTRYSF